MQYRNHALERVIEQHRTYADPDVELEAVRVGEEWLVLTDGLAFVVEDRPAAAHPSRAGMVRRHLRLAVCASNDPAARITAGNRPCFSLGFLLDLTAEAVGIGQAVLNPGSRAWA